MKNLCIAFLTVLLFHCAGTGKWNSVNWPDFSLAELPVQEDYPEEGAIILLDEGRLEITKGEMSFSILKRHRIIKIFNEKGFQYANITIPFSGSTKVRNIRARTILPNGRIIHLQKNEIYEITLYPEYIFYSDIRAKRFSLPAVENGCIIEIEWENQVHAFTYWDRWQIQQRIPVKLSRYQLIGPADWDVNWKPIGIDVNPLIGMYQGTNKKSYLWEIPDIAAFKPEIGMPPESRTAAALVFSPIGMKSWNDFAHWYHQLIKDRIRPTDDIRRVAGEITKNCNSHLEKLQKIYEYARDRVRYVAIEIGIGGYQPHFAGHILQNRFGDCKDKVTLISAMANAVGIDVEPVVISTFQNGKVDTTITTHALFNHLIAVTTLADSQKIWMDATDTFCPFDELPWYDQNMLVFVIDQNGHGKWERTPASEFSNNATIRKWSLSYDSTGNCSGNISFLLTGANALEMRHTLWQMKKDQQKTWFQRDIYSRFPAMKIDNFTGGYENSETVRLSCTFNLKTLFSINQESHIHYESFIRSGWHNLFADEERSYPVEITYPQQVIDSVKINLADNLDFRLDLRNNIIEKPFGRYKIRYVMQDEKTLVIHREFSILSTDISLYDYRDFKDFLRSAAQTDQCFITITKEIRPIDIKDKAIISYTHD